MFGTNELTGKKFFKDAPANSLFVTSMFFTLQGEGPYAGQPALFVRLGKCNLTCSFCDTFFDDGEWMTHHEIIDRASKTITEHWTARGLDVPSWLSPGDRYGNTLNTFPRVVLVLTGGEPMLQDNIHEFLVKASTIFGYTQIESNGILNTKIPGSTTLVVSPKCAEKDGVPTKYLQPSVTTLQRADCLKFVMSADSDSPYNEVPEWAHRWSSMSGGAVYCSPMNIYNDFPQKIKLMRAEKGVITMAERSTVDEVISFWEPGLLNLKKNQANHEYTARYCMDNGFKLNLQMHLYASLA